MSQPTETDIKQVKEKYSGEVFLLSACDQNVLVKIPDEPIFQRFRDDGANDARRSTATKRMLEACVLWPDKSEYAAMIAKQPGLVESFGNKLGTLAGLSSDVETKKL